MASLENQELRGLNLRLLVTIIISTISICAFLFDIKSNQAVQSEKLSDISRRLDKLEDGKTIHSTTFNPQKNEKKHFVFSNNYNVMWLRRP